MNRHPICRCRSVFRTRPCKTWPEQSAIIQRRKFRYLFVVATLAVGSLLSACGTTLSEAIEVDPSQATVAKTAPTGTSAPIATSSIALPQQASLEAVRLTAAADPTSSAYKIGPLDLLDVTVFRVPELSKTVQVAAAGTINLPLVGEVPAAGRTARDVERDLTKRFGGKFLQSPQVNVTIKEYNSQRVTIDGAVKKPGVYPIRGETSLLQLIATAEGLTDTAQTEIAVFRKADGKSQAAKFDLDQIRSGNAKDPVIVEGDLIVVSDSSLKTAYQGLLKALPITSMFITLL
ncbi:polysaccharide biosynthesis/export family protein [Hyphomicrobium denitrificans]|uniref:polysaccharide biosynthesis/export family protein n=1 Tax=Hyphomicrobium denitrificans TaxID=53399 RepID=UPI0009D69771|nr:polysaccharide biosynthesis/export family protein [Hyphomicrobium denitrificans]